MSDKETKTRYRERDGINISTKNIVTAIMILCGGAAVGGFGGMQVKNGTNVQYATKVELTEAVSGLTLELHDSVHRIELKISQLLLEIQKHDRRAP